MMSNHKGPWVFVGKRFEKKEDYLFEKHMHLHGLPHIGNIAKIVAITVIPFLFFMNKAFNIDDPVFIWPAQHILESPLDPMGLVVNWFGTAEPMYEFHHNPWLVNYYLALFGAVFGFGEVAMHGAMLLVSLAFTLGVYQFSLPLTRWPTTAVFLVWTTPVVLVSAHTVMSDMPMLAAYVWALCFWQRGMEGKNWNLWICALLICVSGFSKYFGFTGVPLMLAAGLLYKRRLGAWMLPFLTPIVALFLYRMVSQNLYAVDAMGAAASFAGTLTEESEAIGFLYRLCYGFTFAGACVGTACIAALPFLKKQHWAGLLVMLVALGFFFSQNWLADMASIPAENHMWILVQCVLAGTLAFVLLFLLPSLWKMAPNGETAILVLLLGGAWVFSTFVNWSVNGRTILPMAIPAVLLVMRYCEAQKAASMLRPTFLAVMLLSACLSLLVLMASNAFSNSQREAADIIKANFEKYPGKVYFQGHWGFQYYMEEHGFTCLDLENHKLQQGDLMIVPTGLSGVFKTEDSVKLMGSMQVATLPMLATMERGVGAGFHWHGMGPLPYAFGFVPPQVYSFWHVGEPEGLGYEFLRKIL